MNMVVGEKKNLKEKKKNIGRGEMCEGVKGLQQAEPEK